MKLREKVASAICVIVALVAAWSGITDLQSDHYAEAMRNIGLTLIALTAALTPQMFFLPTKEIFSLKSARLEPIYFSYHAVNAVGSVGGVLVITGFVIEWTILN